MNFTTEQIKKARAAKSAEELFTMAKESGVPMTEDEAKKYFDALHKEGELSETELCAVAGGSKGSPKEPQEYSVLAGWAPSCGGAYCFKFRKELWDSNDCCGTCLYFRYEGTLRVSTEGVCRREFDNF